MVPLLASLVACSGSMVQNDFLIQSMKWRAERESTLKKPEGWLTVAGLFWLNEGENSLGSALGNKVVLPPSSTTSSSVGILTLMGKKVTLTVSAGQSVKVGDEAVSAPVVLKTDADGKPDTIHVGGVTFRIIVRGKRIGVRLYDSNSRYMREFSGCHWYPVNEAFRFKAKYTSYVPARKAQILNILGDIETVVVPGFVEFSVNGKPCRLDAQIEGDTLFFNFKDRTSGTITYPPGRFLNTPKPVDGFVDLDFNRAVNPPCAFTAFATCPLPPKSNILDVRISAGELTHHPAK